MEIRHLRYFCGVAEYRSFSQASARLRVAQPSLSRQIRDLEKELGVDLFIRSSTGVQLTDAGEAFLTHAEKVLAQIALGVSAAQEVGRGKGGEFIIGGDWRMPMNLVPKAVKQLRKLFPNVAVKMLELPMHEHLLALRERRIHVGFLPDMYIAPGNAIETRRIMSSAVVALFPEGNPLASRAKLRVADLKDETWLMVEDKHAPGVKNYYHQLFRLAQISPRVVTFSSSLQSVMTHVAAGEGVTLLPQSMIPERSAGVVAVPMDLEPFELYIVWPKDGASPLVSQFVELICNLPDEAAGM